MRVSESTVLILNEIAACANLGSLMLDSSCCIDMNNVHYALISYEGVQSQERVRCSEGNEKRFYKTTGPEFKTFKS